jgi:DNA mismatch repair protein MutS2
MFEDAIRALEYERVLEAAGVFCRSEVSRGMAHGLAPLSSAEEINTRASIVSELRLMMQSGDGLGLEEYAEIRGLLRDLRPAEAMLNPGELLVLKPALSAITQAAENIVRLEGTLALTHKFTEGLEGFPSLVKRINKTVGSEGEILDSASIELADIRKRLRALDQRVSRRLEEITRESEYSQFLQDDFVTKRSGRWVLPVRMDSKGMVSGVVHDVSRTGETAFMEPIEIIGLSNELENLSAEARAEEIRILRALSRNIKEQAEQIADQFEILLRLDLVNAIAAFAERHALTRPELNTEGYLKLTGALNPRLMLLMDAEVIPLDLTLGIEANVMAITGPNAGGKTVTMKTVGLIMLMALSGIPVPVKDGTSIPFSTGLLADIGDDQSIEAHLSTFSAHATNIAKIIKNSGKGSIVLLDELGTGTDPTQGAALGASILEELNNNGSLVLATTHLVDIVGFVHKTDGMVNSSMAYDESTLTPLYRLRRGEPGQSHAIETAQTYGIPERVIARAKELAGTIQVEFEHLVRDLQSRRLTLEREEEKATEIRKSLEAERDVLKRKLSEAEAKKKSIMKNAYEEAREVVRVVKREAAELLDKAKKDKSKSALKTLDKKAGSLDTIIDGLTEKPVPIAIGDIKDGMQVYVITIRMDAAVVSVDIKARRVRVKAEGKELQVSAESILPPRNLKKKEKVRTFVAERTTQASSELKIIGMRVDAALDEIEPFLNSASLSGLNSVRIIHGLGTGALRNAVREFLTNHPLVESFRSGESFEGGGGATVVELR